jgi:hypothetical protein
LFSQQRFSNIFYLPAGDTTKSPDRKEVEVEDEEGEKEEVRDTRTSESRIYLQFSSSPTLQNNSSMLQIATTGAAITSVFTKATNDNRKRHLHHRDRQSADKAVRFEDLLVHIRLAVVCATEVEIRLKCVKLHGVLTVACPEDRADDSTADPTGHLVESRGVECGFH